MLSDGGGESAGTLRRRRRHRRARRRRAHARPTARSCSADVELTAGDARCRLRHRRGHRREHLSPPARVAGPGGLSVDSGTLTWVTTHDARAPARRPSRAARRCANTGYPTLAGGPRRSRTRARWSWRRTTATSRRSGTPRRCCTTRARSAAPSPGRTTPTCGSRSTTTASSSRTPAGSCSPTAAASPPAPTAAAPAPSSSAAARTRSARGAAAARRRRAHHGRGSPSPPAPRRSTGANTDLRRHRRRPGRAHHRLRDAHLVGRHRCAGPARPRSPPGRSCSTPATRRCPRGALLQNTGHARAADRQPLRLAQRRHAGDPQHRARSAAPRPAMQTVDLRVPVENDGTDRLRRRPAAALQRRLQRLLGQLRRRRRHGAPVERRVAARRRARRSRAASPLAEHHRDHPGRHTCRRHRRDRDELAGTVTGAGALAIASGTFTLVGRHDGRRGHDRRRRRRDARAARHRQRVARRDAHARGQPASPTSRPTAAWGSQRRRRGAGPARRLRRRPAQVRRHATGPTCASRSATTASPRARPGELMLTRGAAQPHTGLVPGHVRDRDTSCSPARATCSPAPPGSTTSPRSPATSPCATGDTLTIADDVAPDRRRAVGRRHRHRHADLVRAARTRLPGTTTIAGARPRRRCPSATGGTSARAAAGEPRHARARRRREPERLRRRDRPEIRNAGRIELDSGGDACGGSTGIVGGAARREPRRPARSRSSAARATPT